MIETTNFAGQYRDRVIKLFEQLQTVTSDEYPPAEVRATRSALGDWIFSGSGYRSRFIALKSSNVVGHIAIRSVSPLMALRSSGDKFQYWKEAFPSLAESDYAKYLEITKFAVLPHHQQQGTGTLLFRRACQEIRSVGKVPVLVVIQCLTSARYLYQRERGQEVRVFEGKFGQTVVSYIFPEDA